MPGVFVAGDDTGSVLDLLTAAERRFLTYCFNGATAILLRDRAELL